MTHLQLLARARQVAAAILPEPELLAPETPAHYVAFCEAEAARIGQNLGDLCAAHLEQVGGADAWRALVVQAVAELAEAARRWVAIGSDGTRYVVWGLGPSEAAAVADAQAQADASDSAPDLVAIAEVDPARAARILAGNVAADDLVNAATRRSPEFFVEQSEPMTGLEAP